MCCILWLTFSFLKIALKIYIYCITPFAITSIPRTTCPVLCLGYRVKSEKRVFCHLILWHSFMQPGKCWHFITVVGVGERRGKRRGVKITGRYESCVVFLTRCWMIACLCSNSLFSMAESMTSWSSCTEQKNIKDNRKHRKICWHTHAHTENLSLMIKQSIHPARFSKYIVNSLSECASVSVL